MFRQAGVFYSEDTTTGKQISLRTKDAAEALTLLNTKNEAIRQPTMNLQITQVYLQRADRHNWEQRHMAGCHGRHVPGKDRPEAGMVASSQRRRAPKDPDRYDRVTARLKLVMFLKEWAAKRQTYNDRVPASRTSRAAAAFASRRWLAEAKAGREKWE